MESKENWPIWATEKITISEPDAGWKHIGESLKNEIETLLTNFITVVEHIGSTSIPGLPAKPIIDLMAKIHSFDDTDRIVEILKPFNWNYVPVELDGNTWRRFFVKVKDDKRFAHLHLVPQGSERWNQHIKFRDKLTGDPQLKKEYAALKVNLAASLADDREAYTAAKSDFILKVLNE